jgi:hypothetical protein
MSTKVYDYTPEAFRRALLEAEQPDEDASTFTALEDMADGVLALDFALTFAGFGYQARQLVHSIVGLVGSGTLVAYDKDVAKHLVCSDRTVRRWRAAHIREARRVRFSLLEIVEGEYDAGKKLYEETAYRFTGASYVNAVVAAARASEMYQTDRRAAIERAAEEQYGDIPDAPARRRTRKPRRAPGVKVERAFSNAARNVEKGRQALQDLGDESRQALLVSSQGEELRRTLLKMQADLKGIIENVTQTRDAEEVDGGYRTFFPAPAECPAPSTVEPRAEDVATWAEIERRAGGEPRVRSRELELRPPWGLQTRTAPEEEMEAEAIRAEASGEL